LPHSEVELLGQAVLAAAEDAGISVDEIDGFASGGDGRWGRGVFCRPLIEVLRRADEAGILQSPAPEADAHSVFALVNAATEQRDSLFPDRASARAHVKRFAWPALGLPLEG
jgi:hypothetical protein